MCSIGCQIYNSGAQEKDGCFTGIEHAFAVSIKEGKKKQEKRKGEKEKNRKRKTQTVSEAKAKEVCMDICSFGTFCISVEKVAALQISIDIFSAKNIL